MRRQAIPGFILLILLFLCSGCDKENEVTCIEDCLDSYLAQQEMVKYQGEDVGCRFFLRLYEYKNKQYYLLGNHCADMVSYPTDCAGNELCQNGEDMECRDFYRNARYIGIVGIK